MRHKKKLIVAGIALAAIAAPATVFLFRDTEAGHHWLERQVEIVSHISLMKNIAEAPPSTFVTDGCSGGMSAFWRDLANQFPAVKADIGSSPPWENCCISHDRAYHNATDTRSADTSFEARIGADQILRRCVADLGVAEPAKAVEFTVLADAIYTSVRLGGSPCSGLPWRWGYGLPPCFVGHQFFEGDD
jgi:hypothetical protein